MATSIPFDEYLGMLLEERKNNQLYREVITCADKIDFWSNDYLGLSRSELLKQYDNTLPSGSTGSRLIAGNSETAEQTEKAIANFHNREAALIFNCGYMANTGLFASLASKGDTYIADELIHASIIDGMRLSYANRFRYRHNDLQDLEQKLKQAAGRVFVVTESLFSMDGDEAPLVELAALCRQYAALLIVDEAHATGVFGNKGEGLVGQYQLQDEVYACIHTYGKALGLHAAAVTGSRILIDYLINFARPFIYSTALPPHVYQQIQLAYKILPSIDRKHLFSLIAYFRQSAAELKGYRLLDSHSQIQGILIPDKAKTKQLAAHLFERGIAAKAILSPTVPAGEERIRICLHSFNSYSEIDSLFSDLKQFSA